MIDLTMYHCLNLWVTGHQNSLPHDDVIKWKHFARYWPFVRGIYRWPGNSLHKGQWPGALMFSLICTWINGWVNNCKIGDLRCYCTHYDVTVMSRKVSTPLTCRAAGLLTIVNKWVLRSIPHARQHTASSRSSKTRAVVIDGMHTW